MAFISMANDVANKSLTCLSNRFITKYLPVLDGDALKVYVIALNVAQGGQDKFEISDVANKLNLTEEEIIGYFKYLEEFELVAITSYDPFNAVILDCENVSGTPKKYKAEKYEIITVRLRGGDAHHSHGGHRLPHQTPRPALRRHGQGHQ
jgi:hypothetical protein